jgi:predicted permease
LLLQSLVELRSVDTGIAIQDLYYFRLDSRTAQSHSPDAVRTTVLQQAAGIPGVEAISFIGSAPMSGSFSSSTTEIPGYEPAPDENMNVIYEHVAPGYFDALQIPHLAGRLFSPADGSDVCVVSQAFAARFFPNASAVGKTISSREEELLIVGVVGDVRQVSLRDDPPPVVYRSSVGYEQPLNTLLFRTSGDPVSVGGQIREAVLAAAPGMSIPRTPTLLSNFIHRSTRVESLLSELIAVFAGLALLLAALGVYGLFSYAVRQRSGEFGVRQALGANHGDVIGLVMRQAGLVLASGALAGLVASLFATRILSDVLYGVSPTDPWTFAASFTVVIAAGLIAAYAPARRAASVNPADLLRHE